MENKENRTYRRSRYVPRSRRDIHAYVFSFMLFAMLVGSIAVCCASSGPIILGTELNTNGMVEYMCLGYGCETLTEFNWAD